jgi:chromosome segregation protein
LQEAKVELATLDNNLRHGVESVSRLERELETMNWQQEEWDEEQARLTGALQLISQQRGDLAELIRTNEAGIAQLKEQIAQGEGQRTQRQSHLTELRIQVAANEERLNAFDNEGAFLKARSDQLQGIMNSQTENAALCRNRAKQHAAAYALRQKEIEALQEDINLQEVEKQSCQQQRQALQEQVSSLDENQRAIAAELAIIEELLRQLQIQEGRHQANLEEWDLRLQEQFGLTLAEAAASIEPVQERRKAQQRIKELRNQVGAMQQVNLGAVEEYERLVERLNFLNEQTEDLIKAKADLEQVIHNMDQLVAKKFKETFEQINLSFNEVFQRLFDGGRAHLYLTDPDDVLDSGVDIMAQPPGKKTQHLSLLSGGEKALTAIALLLAMLRVRPSPFSILDEIESNLDEANVDRFAALVKEYCQDGGQFIVITHRRGTMEVGDVIYGVSAEEASGVSKVISVRMTER